MTSAGKMVRLHASCAARDAAGLLLLGPSGAGKSDLLLRLLDRGFSLVADDQVEVADGAASPPAALAGLLEVAGLGIVRLPYVAEVKLCLAVQLARGERLPMPSRYEILDLPMVSVDPSSPSAPLLVGLALDGVLGKVSFLTGAFG